MGEDPDGCRQRRARHRRLGDKPPAGLGRFDPLALVEPTLEPVARAVLRGLLAGGDGGASQPVEGDRDQWGGAERAAGDKELGVAAGDWLENRRLDSFVDSTLLDAPSTTDER